MSQENVTFTAEQFAKIIASRLNRAMDKPVGVDADRMNLSNAVVVTVT